MYLKKRKEKKKRYRIGLERETEEFLQQVLYHGKDVVFIQTAMEITHFHCKTITLAVICDEQFWGARMDMGRLMGQLLSFVTVVQKDL